MAIIIAFVSADCQTNVTSPNISSDWAPGGLDDVRGPCPMLNTLANHGFLPHDGRNITKENAVFALKTALNFNETFAEQFFGHGIKSNLDANATFFTLDMLNRHNVLEHDASLSRQDAFFGNNHVFNQSIFDQTKQFWTADTLTVAMVANSMSARQLNMKAFNPEYIFTSASQSVTFGEMAAPFLVFGDIPSGTVRKDLVVSWIEIEKLPTELGWVKPAVELVKEDVHDMSERIANASSPIVEFAAAANARRDVGFGHGLF
ncbi:Cloroperoxidase [Cadophora sp. DSE1049]|nr:Cloroperoxidase [Cadophora sp. DSE1049]